MSKGYGSVGVGLRRRRPRTARPEHPRACPAGAAAVTRGRRPCSALARPSWPGSHGRFQAFNALAGRVAAAAPGRPRHRRPGRPAGRAAAGAGRRRRPSSSGPWPPPGCRSPTPSARTDTGSTSNARPSTRHSAPCPAGTRILSLEAPQPLVLAHQRNLSRYQLFGQGMIDYLDDTWPGGKRGFARWLVDTQKPTLVAVGRLGVRPFMRTRFARDYVAVGEAPGWSWYLRRDVDEATRKALRTASRTSPDCGRMTGMTSPASDRLERAKFKYSIVIPVYNSEKIVATTVDRVSEVFTQNGLDHEIILVNDGSTDGSWDVIAEKARTVPARHRPRHAEELRPAPRQPGRHARGRPATTSSPWTTTCRTRPTRRCCSSTRP